MPGNLYPPPVCVRVQDCALLMEKGGLSRNNVRKWVEMKSAVCSAPGLLSTRVEHPRGLDVPAEDRRLVVLE